MKMKRFTIFLFLFTILSFVGPTKASSEEAATYLEYRMNSDPFKNQNLFHKICLSELTNKNYDLTMLKQILDLPNLNTLRLLLSSLNYNYKVIHFYTTFEITHPSTPLANRLVMTNQDLIDFLGEVEDHFENLIMTKARANCFTIMPRPQTAE